jgi:anti-anti-sigma factor
MATKSFSWQTWNSGPFSIERKAGKEPGTVILIFRGPFTMRDVYSNLPTMTLQEFFQLESAETEAPCTKNVLDLSGCPYMDSSGVGMVVSHMVHCKRKGVKMIAAAMTPRVREVFKLTKVDSVVHITATVEEAEAVPNC